MSASPESPHRDSPFSAPLPRRRFLGLLGAGMAGSALPIAKGAAAGGELPKPENAISADQALERLMEGNQRYIAGTMRRHDFAAERRALSSGQNPFAAILSCADSRIGPEFAFDVGRGDVFVVRIAGNFVSTDGLASLEYTTTMLGTPLIVVLGHDRCGAVAAAIQATNDGSRLPGHLPGLVSHLKPAVKAVNRLNPPPASPDAFLAAAIKENVRLNVAKLKTATPLLSKMVAAGTVSIVGAIYRLETGTVELLA